MAEGRSKQAFKTTWLALRQRQRQRQGLEVVAMDGFTGFMDRHHRGTT